MPVGGLQYQDPVSCIFRLDGGFSAGLSPYSFSKEIPHALDPGGGVHVSQHPLHGSRLDRDRRLAQITDQLTLFHIHLGAVKGCDCR